MIIHDMPQRSEEWYRVRAGKLTGSDFHTLLGNSQTRTSLLLEKAAERMIGSAIVSGFTNEHIERGIALESEALTVYSMLTGSDVKTCGFIEYDDCCGCSPDGLIGEDGLLEIKCPKESVFIAQVLSGKIKPEYMTQIQFNLLISGRKWCDYMAYTPAFQPFILRINADQKAQETIKDAILRANSEIEETIAKFDERTR